MKVIADKRKIFIVTMHKHIISHLLLIVNMSIKFVKLSIQLSPMIKLKQNKQNVYPW